MGREWELSFRLGMRPWIAVAYSAPVAAATAVFLIYPIGQGSFSDGMPLGKLFAPPLQINFAALVLFQLMFVMERLETCLNRGSPLYASPQGVWKSESNNDSESAFDQSKQLNIENLPLFVEGNPVLNRLLPRQKPGLYMIRCDVNDKRYYGESTNVSARLNSHRSLLKQGIHPCVNLQKDWARYGEEKFDFVPLYMGHAWNTRNERIKKETSLIEFDRLLCYNKYAGFGRSGKDNGFFNKKHSPNTKEAIGSSQRGVPKVLLGKKIILDGISYPSIAEASRKTNHARKTIRAWLNDPTNLRCTQDD